MPTLILLRRPQISRIICTALRLYHVGRAASVDTAIARGIRKSNGIGLRGKGKPPENDARGKYIERKGIAGFTPRPKDAITKQKRVTESLNDRESENPRIRRGKRDIKPERREAGPWASGKKTASRSGVRNGSLLERGNAGKGYPDRRSFDKLPAEGGNRGTVRGKPSRSSTPYGEGFSRFGDGDARRTEKADRPPRDQSNNLTSGRGDRGYVGSGSRRQPADGRSRNFEERSSLDEPSRESSSSKTQGAFFNRRTGKFEPRSSDGSYNSSSKTAEPKKPQDTSRDNESTETHNLSPLIRRTNKFNPQPSNNSSRGKDTFSKSSRSVDSRRNAESTEQHSSSPILDRRIPLSIPYTTPASEFLYGTSVVEAALSSRRIPRRTLYKLYIYTGENRENAEQDVVMERLAKNAAVQVAKVSGEWIRLLDKMSTGRPHNGYILEASPLPRLPILSLGEVTEKDGLDGFEVVLDHQTREDAAVNGTETFIRKPKPAAGSQRHPLVLYLDSITDPGNLGGIIRTAAFLGVSAVGISTRNSAPFTPVVLKASAGASENVTIFSVNKPAGFIVDSKAAGWKVFAAVAPAKKKDPDMPAAISTDNLDDPLAHQPCILMIGSEGEGLRWNLRSKADSDLYIRGPGHSHGLDSLNVSVATGLLCNAFLSRKGTARPKKEKAAKTPELAIMDGTEDSAALLDPGLTSEEEEVDILDEESPKEEEKNVLF